MDQYWISWIALVLLAAFGGVMILGENAALDLSPADLERIERRTPRAARWLRMMRGHRFRFWVSSRITAIIVIFAGAGVASTKGAAWLAMHVESHDASVLLALTIVGLAYIFLLRAAPRMLARYQTWRTATWLAGPLYAQYLLFLPASRAYEWILSPKEHQAWREPDPGDAAVIEAVQQAPAGAIDATDIKMITNVIELGDRTVRQIMTPRPDIVAVPADAPLPDALRTANTHGLSRLPVYDRDLDNVVGVLHVRDGVAGLLDNVSPSDLRTLARPPLVIPESKFVDRLLREMQAANTHLAIVVNEYGDTAGLVTIEDLLEEIVGEIEDEYDTADTPIEPVGPGQARVAGSLPIADLNDELSLALPISDVHTVGGLAFSAFGRVPTVGDAVTVAGVRLRVLALRDTRITRLEVTRIDRTDA